jgi:hypothetical protein
MAREIGECFRTCARRYVDRLAYLRQRGLYVGELHHRIANRVRTVILPEEIHRTFTIQEALTSPLEIALRDAEKSICHIENDDCTLISFKFRQVEYGGESPHILGGS